MQEEDNINCEQTTLKDRLENTCLSAPNYGKWKLENEFLHVIHMTDHLWVYWNAMMSIHNNYNSQTDSVIYSLNCICP